jgi:hypothetical protein
MSNRFINKLKSFEVLDETDIAALVTATGSGRSIGAKVDLIREGV